MKIVLIWEDYFLFLNLINYKKNYSIYYYNVNLNIPIYKYYPIKNKAKNSVYYLQNDIYIKIYLK